MYKTIVIPLALDQGLAPRLLELARLLKDEDGRLVAVHVLDHVPKYASYYMGDDASTDKQNEILAAAKQGVVDRIGTQEDAEVVVLTGHPGRSITDYAQKNRGRLYYRWLPPTRSDRFLPRLDRGPHRALLAMLGARFTLN